MTPGVLFRNGSSIVLMFFVLLISHKQALSQNQAFKRRVLLMGSAFEFTIVGDFSVDSANIILDDCVTKVKEIEKKISSWDTTSYVHQINQGAGNDTIKVETELYKLIQRSIDLSRLTQGAFSIAFNQNRSWVFDKQEHNKEILQTVAQSELFSSGDIALTQDNAVFLKKKGMKISFGAIGKGYAADEVKKMLVERGIKDGVVNASGDLIAWGLNASGKSWQVGIADPNNRDEILLWMPLTDKAIATSGDYEKYFTVENKRYSHIIDPKTGLPSTGVKSTSVISQKAELSDALATSLFVMGPAVGIDFVDQLPGIECIIIDDKNMVHFSSGFEAKASPSFSR